MPLPFNGSGIFTRLYSWTNDAAANIKIRADRMDAETNGLATGLSTCLTKDGQTTVTSNLPMATFRHTGVGDAVNRTDYASAGQAQDGALNWVAAGGTADAITASYSIPITALAEGQFCFVRAGSANATATPTFAPSGLTAHTITKLGGSALVAGDIVGADHELILRYKLASTRWELLNPKDATTNAAIIAAVLTGYVSGAGTVASSDSILAAIQKLNGNSLLKALLTSNTFTGAQIGTVTALTSSSNSMAIDLSLNNNFSHTFTENTTLANPSNPVAGQSGCIFFTQHASSPKTLAFGSQYKWANGLASTISSTNSALDTLYYNVRDTTHIELSLTKANA